MTKNNWGRLSIEESGAGRLPGRVLGTRGVLLLAGATMDKREKGKRKKKNLQAATSDVPALLPAAETRPLKSVANKGQSSTVEHLLSIIRHFGCCVHVSHILVV